MTDVIFHKLGGNRMDVIYRNDNLILYFSFDTLEFYKETSVTELEEISYKELIEFIKIMPDISEAQKWLLIIEAGKLARILGEIA